MLVQMAGHEVPLGGDIILTVEGIPMAMANAGRLREALARLPSGGKFKATVLRAGQLLELTGTIP